MMSLEEAERHARIRLTPMQREVVRRLHEGETFTIARYRRSGWSTTLKLSTAMKARRARIRLWGHWFRVPVRVALRWSTMPGPRPTQFFGDGWMSVYDEAVGL